MLISHLYALKSSLGLSRITESPRLGSEFWVLKTPPHTRNVMSRKSHDFSSPGLFSFKLKGQ